MNEDAERHIEVCEQFGDVLAQVRSQWDAATPCSEWDVRGVIEHVIGFHDVLLLRPLSAKPTRSRHDPMQRWVVTVDALRNVFGRQDLFDSVVAVPAIGNNAQPKSTRGSSCRCSPKTFSSTRGMSLARSAQMIT